MDCNKRHGVLGTIIKLIVIVAAVYFAIKFIANFIKNLTDDDDDRVVSFKDRAYTELCGEDGCKEE